MFWILDAVVCYFGFDDFPVVCCLKCYALGLLCLFGLLVCDFGVDVACLSFIVLVASTVIIELLSFVLMFCI